MADQTFSPSLAPAVTTSGSVVDEVMAVLPRRSGANRTNHESRSQLTTELLRTALTADADERRELHARVVMMHLDVAESVAWRYHNRGQEHQDLVQIARLGLVEAVERFDPDRGPFLAYATPTMVGNVKRYFRDHGWVVRPPRAIQERQAAISRSRDDLTHELRRLPNAFEIAAHLDISTTDVREAQNIQGCFQPASLDMTVGDGDSDLSDTLGQEEPDLERVEALATVSRACRQLDEDEKRLLYLRFFAMQSQEEIGAEFGISQMQVSRWLRRVLGQLKTTIGDTEPGPSQFGTAA